MKGFNAEHAEPLVGEVVAVRLFEVADDGWLFSLTASSEPWQAGVNRAVCQAGTAHDPPSPACRCGFYAYFRPQWLRGRGVVGVVSIWGHAIVGSRGIRGKYARLEAVALPPDVPNYVHAAVIARYPQARVYREATSMMDEIELHGARSVVAPMKHRSAAPAIAVRGMHLVVAAATAALMILSWTDIDLPLTAVRAAMWAVASLMITSSILIGVSPLPRWSDVLVVQRATRMALLVAPFAIGQYTPSRYVLALIIVLALRRGLKRSRTAPVMSIKPNNAVRHWIAEQRSGDWIVAPAVANPGFRRIDSATAGRRLRVVYLAVDPAIRLATLRHLPTKLRALRALLGVLLASIRPRVAVIRLLDTSTAQRWVDVELSYVDAPTGTASMPLPVVARLLHLPAAAFAGSDQRKDMRAVVPKRRR